MRARRRRPRRAAAFSSYAPARFERTPPSSSFEEDLPAGAVPISVEGATRWSPQALARNPELAAARAEASALAARAPAAGVLSDPMLSVGYENDGTAISLGTEPMSRLIFMVQQAFPFPGKLGAAEKVANADAARTRFRPERAALAVAGAVRRAHADLLEARENQRLVDEQIDTWRQIDETIRARYGAGMGTQQDVLRAQSERTRLLQQKRRDQAAEESALAELRRLLDLPPDAPVAVAARLLPEVTLDVPDRDEAVAKALEATPEIHDAAALCERSNFAADLAKRGTQPDFVVTAAYMNRGSLPLMWSASVGVTLPLFARSAHAAPRRRGGGPRANPRRRRRPRSRRSCAREPRSVSSGCGSSPTRRGWTPRASSSRTGCRWTPRSRATGPAECPSSPCSRRSRPSTRTGVRRSGGSRASCGRTRTSRKRRSTERRRRVTHGRARVEQWRDVGRRR